MKGRGKKKGGGHSGPGGCRINLSKCTKNAAKRGNVTLTIAYHENEINLYGSFKKNDFQSKNIFDLVNGDFGHWGAIKQPAERPNDYLPEN